MSSRVIPPRRRAPKKGRRKPRPARSRSGRGTTEPEAAERLGRQGKAYVEERYLDEAAFAQSIIERIATLLAVVFAVMAFGGNFPPKYLVGHAWTKVMVFVVLACYLLSMGLGMLAIQPRSYDLYRENLTRMRRELDRMVAWKKRWVFWAGILFALGTAALAILIALIILPV